MKNYAIFFSCLLLSMIVPSSVMSSCLFTLTVPTLNYTMGNQNSGIVKNFSLQRNTGGDKCHNFYIGLTRGTSATYQRVAVNPLNGATLAYNLYGSSSLVTELQSLADAKNQNQLLTGTISSNTTIPINYYFALGASSAIVSTRAGTYSDNVQVEASKAMYPSAITVEATKALSVIIVVPKAISLSLVDTGVIYNASSTSKILDFGELTENEELGFSVRVLSNAGYALSVSSANNQKLQLEGSSAVVGNQISYDFYAENNIKVLTSSLATPVQISSGTGVSPAGGANIPIRVVIKSVANKNAGIYKDSITFTVATIE